MIIRIVTMSFHEKDINTFLTVFEKHKNQIRASKGCLDLQLIQNTTNSSEISTLSKWDCEESLTNYKNSPVFKTVWPLTKKLFSERPKASSYISLTHVK